MVLAAALLASGCGGPLSKKEYEQEMNRIGGKVDKSIDKLSTSESQAPTGDDISKVADEMGSAADDMEALSPPKEIEKTHDLMVRGLRRLSEAFDTLAGSLEETKGNKQRMEKFLNFLKDEKAQSGLADLSKAQEQFAAKDYRVFPDSTANGGK